MENERNRAPNCQSTVVRCLTIAGSDSGGGAGIQADLKTFSALNTHGMSVVTAVTAQNTMLVSAVQLIDPSMVQKQIEAVIDDIGVDSIKIGMLGSPDIVRVVARTLRRYPTIPVILDTVMVSKSGCKLLNGDSANSALVEDLIPQCDLITPNLPEALSLLNEPFTIANLDDAKALTSKLRRKLGCSAVLLKGGHIDTVPSNDVVADILDDGKEVTVFTTRRLKTKNTHGTGCTLSAAIAASVARGSASLVDAVRQAKEYIQGAIETSIGIGSGHGCLHHMWQHNSCPLKPELRSQQVPTETVTACDWLWEAANVGALLEKIVNHPFIQGLRNGGLNIDAFKRFVIQDSLYLRHFGRGLALIASRTYSSDRVSPSTRQSYLIDLLEFSNGTITAELDMHGSWLKEWNIQIREEDMSPACQLYTSYLISTAYDRPFEEAAVAYLPCFWIYHLVGQALAQHGSPDPMYQRWIEEYSSKEFEKSVDKMKAIVNQVCEGPLTADKKEILLNHFKRTCQMEYMFWDSAYKNNQWPH